jgi:hypothetical protein
MAVNNEFPVLNGIVPSWADVSCKLTATGAPVLKMVDIKSINSSVKVEVGEQRGASGGRVLKRTTGQVSYEASTTAYRDGYQNAIKVLKGAAKAQGFVRGNQSLISLVHFGYQVQHTPPGSVSVFEYRVKGCRLLGRDMNGAEGTDPDTVDMPMSALEIVDMIDGEEVAWL